MVKRPPTGLLLLDDRACHISSVTLTELKARIIGRGKYTPAQIRQAMTHPGPLMTELTFDAACLGSAEAYGLSVLTAEKNWAKLPDLRMGVELIR